MEISNFSLGRERKKYHKGKHRKKEVNKVFCNVTDREKFSYWLVGGGNVTK